MKKVFSSSSDVMHLYANQQQTNATNQSRNVYFNRTSIYSYGEHYKLAKILDTKNAILINNNGYSVTTSKHINEISHASRHLKRFYSQDVFIKNALQRIETLVQKLPKARSSKAHYIATIKAIFNSFQKFQTYCNDNKLSSIKWSNNTIINLLVDKRSKEYKRLLFIAQSMNNIQLLEKDVLEAQKKQKTKEAKKQKQLIKLYRDNKRDFVRLDYDLLSVRYKGEQPKLEFYIHTSQNVCISLEDGIKAIKSLKALEYNYEAINTHLKGYKIGWHRITKATKKALFVGCHKIEFKEIKRISKQIKLIK